VIFLCNLLRQFDRGPVRTEAAGYAFHTRIGQMTQQRGDEMARTDHDPQHHTQMMQRRLQETVQHLREDIEKVDEPQLKAMFETSAEVLGGLIKAFRDYEEKTEPAWR
jgi:hypothetical protein